MHRLSLIIGLLLNFHILSLAQSVGIGTALPDISADLDIFSNNKGLLIPQINLQGVNDVVTIPLPAPALMIFHTGNTLGGQGFFYNSGTWALPTWKRVDELRLPYYYGGAEGTMFNLENYKQNATTIRAINTSGPAVDIEGGFKVAGPTQSPGVGKVLTSDATGNVKWGTSPVAFRSKGIKMGGSEKISSRAKVPFLLEEYDLTNAYNDLNQTPHSIFTAPVKGIYHFDATVNWDKFDEIEINNGAALMLYKVSNGNDDFLFGEESKPLPSKSISISGDIPLLPGDQIYVYFATGDISGKYTYLTDGFFSGSLVMGL